MYPIVPLSLCKTKNFRKMYFRYETVLKDEERRRLPVIPRPKELKNGALAGLFPFSS